MDELFKQLFKETPSVNIFPSFIIHMRMASLSIPVHKTHVFYIFYAYIEERLCVAHSVRYIFQSRSTTTSIAAPRIILYCWS